MTTDGAIRRLHAVAGLAAALAVALTGAAVVRAGWLEALPAVVAAGVGWTWWLLDDRARRRGALLNGAALLLLGLLPVAVVHRPEAGLWAYGALVAGVAAWDVGGVFGRIHTHPVADPVPLVRPHLRRLALFVTAAVAARLAFGLFVGVRPTFEGALLAAALLIAAAGYLVRTLRRDSD